MEEELLAEREMHEEDEDTDGKIENEALFGKISKQVKSQKI